MQRKQVTYQEDNMENVHNQTKQLIKLAKNINCQVPLQCIEKCELPDVQASKSMSKLYNVNEDICLEEFDPYWSNYFKSQKDSTANYLYNIDVYGPSKDPTYTSSKNEPIPNELVRQRLQHIPPIGVLNRDNMFHILNFILNIIRLSKERQMQWMQHFKNRKMLDNELLNYMQLIARHENSGLTAVQKDDFCSIVQELFRDGHSDFADNYFHPEHIFRKSLMDMDPYEMAYLNDIMLAKDDLNMDEYIYLANFVHQLQKMKVEQREHFLKYLHNKGVLPSPQFSSLVYAMGQKTKPFDEERAKVLVKELQKAMNIASKDAETPAKLLPKREGIVTSIDIDPLRLQKSFDNLMKGGIPNIVRLNDMKSFIRDMQIFSRSELERMLNSLKDAYILDGDKLKFLQEFINSNNNLSLAPEKRKQLLDAINSVNKSSRADSVARSIPKQAKKIGKTVTGPGTGTSVGGADGATDLASNKLAAKLKTGKKIDTKDIDTKISEAIVPSADIKPIDQLIKEEKTKDKLVEKSKSDEKDKRKDEIRQVEEDIKSRKKKPKGKNLDKKQLIIIESGDSDVGGKAGVGSKTGSGGKAGVSGSATEIGKIDVTGKASVGGKSGAAGKVAAGGDTAEVDVTEGVTPAVGKSSAADKKRGKLDAKSDGVKIKMEGKGDFKKEVQDGEFTAKRREAVTLSESEDVIEVKPKSEIKKMKVEDEHADKKGKRRKSKLTKKFEDEFAADSKQIRLLDKTVDAEVKARTKKPDDKTEQEDNLIETAVKQPKKTDGKPRKERTRTSMKGGRKFDKTHSGGKGAVEDSEKEKAKGSENEPADKSGVKSDRDQDSILMDQDRYSIYGEDTKSITGDTGHLQLTRDFGVRQIDDKLFAFLKNSQYRMYKDSEDNSKDMDDAPDYSYMLTPRGTTFTSVLDGFDESSFRNYRTPTLRPPNVFITTASGYKVPLIYFRMLFFHFSTRKGPSKHIVSIKNGSLILR